MTNYLILIVLIVIIGAFITKFGELFEALLGLIKWLAIPSLIALLIIGLLVIWPSIQQFFSKIFEVFSGIPKLFSKIPGLFSDIISWFIGTL